MRGRELRSLRDHALHRRRLIIRQHRRDLHLLARREFDLLAAHGRKAAARCAQALGDVLAHGHVGDVEVEVEIHDLLPGAAGDRAGGRMNVIGSEIGAARFVLADQLLETLELPFAHVREILSFGPPRRVIVEIHRYVQLASDALAQLLRQLDALLDSHAGDRNKRDHIDGAHARVLALMDVQVDQLRRFLGDAEARLHARVGRADEREDAAMMIGVRLDVQNRHPGRLRRVDDRLNLSLIPAF